MNLIFLIGNGFDLAHGYKTSYTDFILWYLNTSFRNSLKTGDYADQLIDVTIKSGRKELPYLKLINDLTSFKETHNLGIQVKSPFFRRLLNDFTNLNWVDLEYLYYTEILGLYRRLEKENIDSHVNISDELKRLNTSFEFLKNRFEDYLKHLDVNSDSKIIDEIKKHFTHQFLTYNIGKGQKASVMVVNFNYTNTVERYFAKDDADILNIHGAVSDSLNPVIFGYGDEMDRYYPFIERLNNDDFLKFFKSPWYTKTSNYRKLTQFTEKNKYCVLIMGHSCGISDRILLNSLFENVNCELIKIFYYKKSQDINDYMKKVIQISRHFSTSSKHKMRKIIQPLSESKPLLDLIES